MHICGPKQSRFMRSEIIYEDCYGLRHFYPGFFRSVLDIGANVGYFSLMCRFLFPKARVVAIEPQEAVFSALSKNAIFLDVEPVHAALSDGNPVFFIPRHQGTWGARYDTDGGGDKVEGATLGQLVARLNLDPDTMFLKVDCEGAERHLMDEAASESVLRLVAAGAMEVHALPDNVPIQQFKAWLDGLLGSSHDVYWGEIRTDRQGRERLTHVKFVRRDVPRMNELTPPPTKVSGRPPKSAVVQGGLNNG